MLRIFLPWKIQRLWAGSNQWTWVPEASMLTPRPPKPLFISFTICLLVLPWCRPSIYIPGLTADILLSFWHVWKWGPHYINNGILMKCDTHASWIVVGKYAVFRCYSKSSIFSAFNTWCLLFYEACPESKDTKVLIMFSLFKFTKVTLWINCLYITLFFIHNCRLCPNIY
jgi:hypothetical protein